MTSTSFDSMYTVLIWHQLLSNAVISMAENMRANATIWMWLSAAVLVAELVRLMTTCRFCSYQGIIAEQLMRANRGTAAG